MSILYILIPLGLVLLAVAIWAFMWAVRSGQFEDMDGPAYRILMDDDDPRIPENRAKSRQTVDENADRENTDDNSDLPEQGK